MKEHTYKVIYAAPTGAAQVIAKNQTRAQANRLINRHRRMVAMHCWLVMRREDKR